ncbi:MAG: ribosome maturation factor RimM [Bacteroidota bacterium]
MSSGNSPARSQTGTAPLTSDLIAVGRILSSVGIRGEVKVEPLTDDPLRFDRLTTILIGRNEGEAEPRHIESVRYHKGNVVLKLHETETRTASDQLRGWFLYVAETEAVRPERGSYFIHEIVGMKAETEDGVPIGTVTDVRQFPAQDLWVVTSGTREILIPAVKEFIRSVDRTKRVIIVRPIEGMMPE